MQTHQSPYMQGYTKGEIDERYWNGSLELRHKDANQASLEDECWEKQQKYDDDCENQAEVLNSGTDIKKKFPWAIFNNF